MAIHELFTSSGDPKYPKIHAMIGKNLTVYLTEFNSRPFLVSDLCADLIRRAQMERWQKLGAFVNFDEDEDGLLVITISFDDIGTGDEQ